MQPLNLLANPLVVGQWIDAPRDEERLEEFLEGLVQPIERLDAQAATGRSRQALAASNEALVLAQRLVALDRGNFDYQEVLAGRFLKLGGLEIELGAHRAASAHLMAGKAAIKAMQRHDRTNRRWQLLGRDFDTAIARNDRESASRSINDRQKEYIDE